VAPALLLALLVASPAMAGSDIAAWKLDEQRGSQTLEAVSGRHDPVDYVFNHARFKPDSDPLWRPAAACIKGGCLLFDGYSTDITAPGLTDAQLGAGWTMNAWVAPHAFEWGDGGQYSAFLSQFDEDAKAGFTFGMYRFGTWGIKLGFGGTVFDLRVTDRKLPRDTWSHVAASYEPHARLVRLYLNGEQVAAGTAPAEGSFALPPRALTIGRYSQPRVLEGVFRLNTYLGLMDEVRIAAGAATDEEMARRVRDDLAAHGGRAPVPTQADVTIDRATFAGDRHRPQYHALPDSGWMNEPHAPFYQDGRYHLFFQKNPFGPIWHQIHWGHWVSPDMVHWRELPMALAPEDDTLAPDGIWSGSATHAKDGTPVLFFTAGNDKGPVRERVGLAQPLAPLDPDLRRWNKYPVPVTEPPPGPGHTGDFRDPFVFRDDAGDRWFELVGSRVPDGSGVAFVHESTDLVHWRYRGPLFTLDAKRYPGFESTFELPVLLPIGKGRDGRPRHVFLTDVKAQAYYWIGVFDSANARFIPDSEAPRVFDLGDHHFSGPSGFIDPRTGRTIVFSIAQGERSVRDEWAAGWAHNAGLPVTLAIGPDDDLRLAPIDELASLRQELLLDLADVTPAAAAARLARVKGDLLEVELELEPTRAPAPGNDARRGLVVRRSPDDAEHTDLVVDPARRRFEIDRTHTTLDPDARSRGVQGGPFDLRRENLRLRVFLDRSMVEAYLNDRKSITSRMYPSRPDATGLGLIAAAGDRVAKLRVWRMGALDGGAATWHPSR
jgi:sucrose-6-phosphate hydrolase SacC (GH32 family)